MRIHDFIFSNNKKDRIRRHIAFWSVRLLFYFAWQLSVYFIIPLGVRESHINSFLSFLPIAYGLVMDMVYCYLFIYWILPRYLLKRKYLTGGILAIILTLVIFTAKLFFHNQVGNIFALPSNEIAVVMWMSVLSFFNIGPPVVCAIFLAIKLLKNWYMKEEEKLALTRENANAELQLLKAQIHPHFLFNTLNNIYSFTLHRSVKAETLVDKLSHVLRYMITDCASGMVPLNKELKMIIDYIGLEKVRYGDRLKMHVEITGDAGNKMISPLMMIPFVENSFKHGTSQVLEHPWVKLEILITQNQLFFQLSNSKPATSDLGGTKKGIGLLNVQKRLQLLYPGLYKLVIDPRDEIYSVTLQIPLLENEEENVRVVSKEHILSF